LRSPTPWSDSASAAPHRNWWVSPLVSGVLATYAKQSARWAALQSWSWRQATCPSNGLPMLTGSAQITLAAAPQPDPEPQVTPIVPLVLDPVSLERVLGRFADCGPLNLIAASPNGIAPSEPVIVRGQFADGRREEELRRALTPLVGDRQILLDTVILNDVLCQIEQEMPDAPSGGMTVTFGYGERDEENRNGLYNVGDNPVIDVVIPADMTRGFLWVSIVDVSGNVYHLLPNRGRPDNSVALLRDGATGAMPIRVAFALSDSDGGSNLAFLVDDTTLGKSKVVAIHSDAPLFPELRPSTESVGGFAEALAGQLSAGIDGVDSRVLTTEQ